METQQRRPLDGRLSDVRSGCMFQHVLVYQGRRSERRAGVRPTIDMATEERDIHWMFPSAASHDHVDSLASALSQGTPHAIPSPAAITRPDPS